MSDNKSHTICFGSPAKCWEEALPVGNGRLGGMVFGLPYTERIQLNEDSVWFGGPQNRNNPSALENLPKIRSLIMEGRIREAQELCTFALSGLPRNSATTSLSGIYILSLTGRRWTTQSTVGNLICRRQPSRPRLR